MHMPIIGLETGFTLFLAVIAFIIVIYAQISVSSSYKKFKRIKCENELSGFEVARKILDKHQLNDVHIVEVAGELSDHYDPRRKVVRLSKDIFHGTSIAAVSIAAHEVGHAIQDKEKYVFMNLRAFLVPFVNFVTYIGYFAIVISLFAGITTFLTFGIIMLVATLIFQLVTLPVEFDASRRANGELLSLDLINKSEESKVKAMLNAAAMTYVAALISTLLNLLRLIMMYQNRN